MAEEKPTLDYATPGVEGKPQPSIARRYLEVAAIFGGSFITIFVFYWLVGWAFGGF